MVLVPALPMPCFGVRRLMAFGVLNYKFVLQLVTSP